MRLASSACGLLLMVATAFAADTDIVRLTEAMENAKRSLATDCAKYRADLPAAEGFKARNRAEQGIIVSCECMPAELDKVVADANVPRELSRGEAKSRMVEKMTLCGMQAMRKTFATACPTIGAPPDVSDTAGYCKCYLDEMNQYSDAQLLADTIRMRDNVKERDAARAAGKEPPAEYLGLPGEFMTRCHARWRRK